jgi:hypothetical protein
MPMSEKPTVQVAEKRNIVNMHHQNTHNNKKRKSEQNWRLYNASIHNLFNFVP